MEEIIYQYLLEQQNIAEKLASYSNIPAIFNREAPASTDESWGEDKQYPRIIFGLDMQEDPERKTSGSLIMDVYISDDVFLEDIIPIVKDAVSGCFFSDSTDTIAVMWRQTDPFATPEDGSQIAGATITFDVVAFPSQHLNYPCPVTAVDNCLKALFPTYKILGIDTPSGTFRSTDSVPVLYTRLSQILPGTYPGNYHVTWYNPVMIVHIIAPSVTVRETISKKIIEHVQKNLRIKMPDNSPMMIQRLMLTAGADQLKTGQLSIEGSYGILREYPDTQKINHINIE